MRVLSVIWAMALVACGGEGGSQNAARDTVPDRNATPTATTSSMVDPDEAAELITRLREFAREPTQERLNRIPFADEVALGLGEHIVSVLPAEQLLAPDSWQLETSGLFRGYIGPFELLQPLRDARPAVVSVGSHPHCASPPRPAPDAFATAQRVSTQPEAPECLSWYCIDVFLDEEHVAAVTLDVWEP